MKQLIKPKNSLSYLTGKKSRQEERHTEDIELGIYNKNLKNYRIVFIYE
jgi:hypothetical protein